MEKTEKSVAAVIVAAGSGVRAGFNKNKLLFNVGTMTVLERTLAPFLSHPSVSRVVVSVSERDFDAVSAIVEGLSTDTPVSVVLGGASRTESVARALAVVPDSSAELVAVHDGARPFVPLELLTRLFAAAKKTGAAIPVLPVADTVKRVRDGLVAETPDRRGFVSAATPQVFSLPALKKAYAETGKAGRAESFTDDAGVYEKYVGAVLAVEGSPDNVKLTTPRDFCAFFPRGFIVGTGYDVHRLEEGRRLILGGVKIPFELGLIGHSDADVVAHAVMDAMLSALNIGDIGVLFPDTDPRYEGADSMRLTADILKRVTNAGFRVNNVSVSIIAERPRLSPHIDKIRASLAAALSIPPESVSASATTNERLGLVGEGRGIACHATVSMLKDCLW